MRQDGDAYTVLGLVLGRYAIGGRFGYGGTLDPPTPWHWVLSWMRGHERYVEWGTWSTWKGTPSRSGSSTRPCPAVGVGAKPEK